MLLDNFFKNLIYEPVSVLGLLVFYFLLINLPISLGAVFKKKVFLCCKAYYDFSELINNISITF